MGPSGIHGLLVQRNIGWVKELGDDTGGPYNNNSATDWGVNLDAARQPVRLCLGRERRVDQIQSRPRRGDDRHGHRPVRRRRVGREHRLGPFPGRCPRLQRPHVGFRHATAGHAELVAGSVQRDGRLRRRRHRAGLEGIRGGHGPDELRHRISISCRFPTCRRPCSSFPSSSRRYYTLQGRDNLLAGDWTNVTAQTDIQGAGGLDSLQDTNVTPRQFYRVGVKVSP